MARGKKRKPRKNRGPKDFRMFPELPIELRLRIWEMSIPDPQLIAIGCEFGYDSHSMQRRRTKDCAAFYKIPALLHTNKESRSVAESVYREEFADRLGGNGIWMDISKDILCFRRVLACDIFFRGKAECVRTDSDFRSNKPLVERLHALAFDFLAPNFEKSPQILTRMGKPQTIYCLGEFAETASHQGKWVEGEIDKGWQDNSAWLKIFKYQKPKVVSMTSEQMRTWLAESSPPTTKPKRIKPNLAKAFLARASFQRMI